MAGLTPRAWAKQMMVECIEHTTVGNEKEQFVRVQRHPLGNDRRNAVEYLKERIGIRREDVAGRLVGCQAMLCFDLVNHKPIEATKISFDESPVDVDGLLELFGNYCSRRDRPDQGARNDAVDADANETLRCCMGLSNPGCV